MPQGKTILTHEGYLALRQELDELKTIGRDNIAEKIKEARSFGDLSENAEYDEAMNEQAKMEARIARLDEQLSNAIILDEEDLSTEVVGAGSRVKLKDVKFDEMVEYQILGQSQSNPDRGIISDQSPIGKALLGHRVGDTVSVEVPSGAVLSFEILSISK